MTPTLDLVPVQAATLQPERPPVNAPYKHGQVPTGKPKASDYDPRVDKLIIHACHQYEVLLSTEEPFPEAGSPVMWASRVWSDVCRSAEVNYTLSDRIEKIVSSIEYMKRRIARAEYPLPFALLDHRTVFTWTRWPARQDSAAYFRDLRVPSRRE